MRVSVFGKNINSSTRFSGYQPTLQYYVLYIADCDPPGIGSPFVDSRVYLLFLPPFRLVTATTLRPNLLLPKDYAGAFLTKQRKY